MRFGRQQVRRSRVCADIPPSAETPRAPVSPGEVARDHDRRRRARLLRIVTLGVLAPILLLLPSAIVPAFDIVSFVALVIVLLFALAAFALNRLRQCDPAGYTLLLGIVCAIAWDILGKAYTQHGVDLGDLRLYDLFAIPVLLSGVLVSRRGPVIIAVVTTSFTAISLILLPKTPPLQLYWNGDYRYVLGSSYDVLAIAVLLQALTAVVAWLGADSIRRVLLDASRAEELEAANARNSAQAQELALQRLRLRAGIKELQHVHSAVARGHWEARAHVGEGELLPVAMSLNLLLDRLTRLTREQEQRSRLECAARQLAAALRRMRRGKPYAPPAYSGTVLDDVLVELSSLRQYGVGGVGGAPTGFSSARHAALTATSDRPRSGSRPASRDGSPNPCPDVSPTAHERLTGWLATGVHPGAVAPGKGDRWPTLAGDDLDWGADADLPEWLRPTACSAAGT